MRLKAEKFIAGTSAELDQQILPASRLVCSYLESISNRAEVSAAVWKASSAKSFVQWDICITENMPGEACPFTATGSRITPLFSFLTWTGAQHLQGRVQKRLLKVSYCGDGQCVWAAATSPQLPQTGGGEREERFCVRFERSFMLLLWYVKWQFIFRALGASKGGKNEFFGGVLLGRMIKQQASVCVKILLMSLKT